MLISFRIDQCSLNVPVNSLLVKFGTLTPPHPPLQSEIQDHQTFETEVGASQERVQAVVAEGNRLLQEGRCGNSDEIVSESLTSVLFCNILKIYFAR